MKLLIIFLLFTNIYADNDRKHINKELSHLNLTKNQLKKIKNTLKEFRNGLKQYRDLKEDIEDEREDIFSQNTLDIKKLNKLNKILDNKSNDIENKLLKKIHSILTPKQRAKFIDDFDDWEVE